MSSLCASAEGMTFNELKEACAMTDGNLSRHLQALEKEGAVKIKKSFVDSKPRTTVAVSQSGRLAFVEYLGALEEMLEDANRALKAEKKTRRGKLPLTLKPLKA